MKRQLIAAALVLARGAPARAGVPEQPGIQDVLAELVPAVEQAEGRRFLTVPTVAVASRRAVQRMLERSTRERAEEWVADYDQLLADRAIAIYSRGDETIYLLDDALSELEPDMRRWGVSPRPLLHCVLAHELLHALQHQYAPWVTEDGTTRPLAALALLEGHAELASAEYCRARQPEVADFFATLGAPALAAYGAAPQDRSTLIYGYGLAAARLLQEAGGRAAIWAALSDAPPFELLRAAVEPEPAEGWDDPELLCELAEPLLPGGGWEITAEVGRHGSVGALLTGGAEPSPRALAGQTCVARRGLKTASLLALLMPSSQEAEALVRRRASALTHARREPGADLFFPGRVQLYSPRQLKPRSLRSVEGGETLRLELPGYSELWATRGAVVLAGFFDGVPLSRQDFAGRLDALEARAATEPPPPAPADPEVAQWLDAMAAAGAADEPGISWQYRLEQLADRLAAGDVTACNEAAEAASAEVPEHQRAALAEAVYACAVLVRDLDSADAMLARMAPDARPSPSVGHDHALMLRDAGRPDEGLALLDRVQPAADPELAQSLRGLRMMLLAELGRLDEAAAMARDRQSAPASRAYVASALARQGRASEALSILLETCPSLEGEFRVHCDQLRVELSP